GRPPRWTSSAASPANADPAPATWPDRGSQDAAERRRPGEPHCDGDLSLCAAIFQVAYGLGCFGERIRLSHDGSDVAGLDLLPQCFEVSLAVGGDVHGQPLGEHRREYERSDLPPDPSPPGALAASGRHMAKAPPP